MLFKVDIHKAYDTLEWGFIDLCLKTWCFSTSAKNMVMSSVSNVRYSLLLNRGICGSFKPKHGLRQGEPLSPFFFILCTEILSRMLCVEVIERRIYGIKLGHTTLAVTNLLCVEDMSVSCKGNEDDTKT